MRKLSQSEILGRSRYTKKLSIRLTIQGIQLDIEKQEGSIEPSSHIRTGARDLINPLLKVNESVQYLITEVCTFHLCCYQHSD